MTRMAWLVAAMSPAPLLAAEALQVQVPAQYGDNVVVMGHIRNECALEGAIGKQVFDAVRKRYPDATQVADPAQAQGGRVLKLTILAVEGYGGGGWSGSKAMTVRADLVQDGVVVQSGVRRERSRGGILGPARGTCSIFELVAESLGQQFAAWLVYVDGKAPASNAAGASTPPPSPAVEPTAPAADQPPPAEPAPLPAPAGDNPQSAS
ncbi:hypothetical protein [Herbaspirillum sp. YR522]|uniref:hypothetical protein n=1 Tax=Herbaspirillum sp. YR522 TaxID=1144342 RepID=UPI0002E12F7A|nr:hypothetical protein [Herbaspirillum sp. YR522]